MGELHLDIIQDRIRKEYKIDVELGPLQISYRETTTNTASGTGTDVVENNDSFVRKFITFYYTQRERLLEASLLICYNLWVFLAEMWSDKLCHSPASFNSVSSIGNHVAYFRCW